MNSQTLKIAFKTLFGLLGLTAIITEIVVLVGRNAFDPANFFSYFTVLSNIFAFTMLFIRAYALATRKKSPVLNILRGAAALYMVVTGIIFATLLAGIEGAQFTAVPWDNIVLHYIIPVVMLLDWLIDRPSTKILYRQSIVWLIFPLLYVVYSLIRGSIVGWYPYPFLDPAKSGYEGVLVTSIGITVVCIVVSLLLVKISRLGKLAKTTR